MGFFSSVGSIFGGSESSSQSGFQTLPKEIQRLNKGLAKRTYDALVLNDGSDYFTPLPETADETRGFDMIREGFTPTEESLNSDISMLMNPYDDYVVDDINRQALGDYSLIKQAVSEAGQFGSNRQVLGASEVEDRRLSNVGKFRQDQYNKVLDQALNVLPSMRAKDAYGLLGIGEFQRNLDTQTKQAPIQSYLTAAQIAGILPQSGGSINKTTDYGSGILGNLAQATGSYFAAGGGGGAE